MVFNVFENGHQVTRPWRELFPNRRVGQASALANIAPISEEEEAAGVPQSPNHRLKEYQGASAKKPDRRPVRFAHEIMSKPVIDLPLTSDLDSAWLLFEIYGIRHLPVVSEKYNLVGILSDRDILRAWSGKKAGPTSVKDVMTKQVLTATPDTEIRILVGIMVEHRIGAVPIVNEEKKLTGMLSRSDILKTMLHQVPVELWS